MTPTPIKKEAYITTNGWNEWSRHVLAELERLNECYKSLDVTQRIILTEIAMLKIKSGLWGAGAGMIPATIALLFWWLGCK